MEVFVVRLWTPSAEETAPGETVRGTALHVPSGTEVVFAEPEALLRFLERQTALAGRSPTRPSSALGSPLGRDDP